MESEVEDDLQSPLLGGSSGKGGGGAPPQPPLQRLSSLPGPSPLGPGAPLPVITIAEDASAGEQRSKGSGLLVSTVILSKTIVGAGAAALPRAFVALGLLLAGGFLLLVGYMTHWSIEALTLGTVVTGEAGVPAGEACGPSAGSLGGCSGNSVRGPALTCPRWLSPLLEHLGCPHCCLHSAIPTSCPPQHSVFCMHPHLPAGHQSYPEVVRALCGRRASLLLQLSLVFRCAGLMIVYVSC
jgi:hypothetical protein